MVFHGSSKPADPDPGRFQCLFHGQEILATGKTDRFPISFRLQFQNVPHRTPHHKTDLDRIVREIEQGHAARSGRLLRFQKRAGIVSNHGRIARPRPRSDEFHFALPSVPEMKPSSFLRFLTSTAISTKMAFSFFDSGTYAGPVNLAENQTSSQVLSSGSPSVSV